MNKSCMESLADVIERWSEVAAGFVLGFVAVSFLNIAFAVYLRAKV